MTVSFGLTITGIVGLLVVIGLFVLGVAADELVRQFLHWIMDSRLAYAGRYLRLYVRDREIPVEATKTVRLNLSTEGTDREMRQIRDRLRGSLSSEFDNVDLVGDWTLHGISRHEAEAVLDVRIAGNQTPASELECVLSFTMTGRIPYRAFPDHLSGLFTDLERAVVPALTASTIAKYSAGAASLAFSIRTPPRVLDLFSKFKIAELRGVGDGVQIALTGKELTVTGDLSSDLSRIVRQAVTWYH
jgi:hypothetical protein